MVKDEQEGAEQGELISFSRWLKGWPRAKLARKTGIDKSQLSRYESGEEAPRPANLQRIFLETGVSPRVHDFIRWCLRLIRQAVREGKSVAMPAGKPEIRQETRAAVGSACGASPTRSRDC
jgi:transcriptional regulator with XRE-family HTH domain